MGKIILWYKNGGEPRVFENKAAFVSTAKNWDLEDAGCKVFDVDDPDAIWEDANKWMTTYINKQNAAQAEHDRKRIAELEMRLIKLETEVKRAQGVGGGKPELINK